MTFLYFNIISVEYILGQTDKLVLSLECNNTTADAITYFFRNMSYSHIFLLMDYDIVKGLILEGINLQLTFIWTYNDLFIMFLSTALAYRFRQITTKIQSVSDAKVSDNYTRDCKFLIYFSGWQWNHLEKTSRGLRQTLQILQSTRRTNLLHCSSSICLRLVFYLSPTM